MKKSEFQYLTGAKSFCQFEWDLVISVVKLSQ